MTNAAPEMGPALWRTGERYRDCGRFVHAYVRAKLRHDPINEDLLSLGSGERFGTVLDVGCGRGQLGIVLLKSGLASSVLGLDLNPRHLQHALQAARGLAFQAEQQDLSRDQALTVADTILMVDVLYQLEPASQRALLCAAATAARQRILIRTADPDRGLRSVITRMLELLGRRVWPHSGAHVNPPEVAVIDETLATAGFSIAEAPCWRGTPFANILLIARRDDTWRLPL